jgi:hypothetical protein
MSQINIEIVVVDKSSVPTKKGSYEVYDVTFKSLDFKKVESKKLLSFATDKEVWKTVGDSQKGDVFAIDREKDDKGYWQWVSIARQDGAVGGTASASKPSSSVTTKSTYQTPEERAAVQLYIIRQSSIASAVNLMREHGTNDERTPISIIAIAKQFESYVLGENLQTIEELTDDIPY